MWILIIAIVIILIIVFIKYDKDFIKAFPLNERHYRLVFETDREAECELVDIFEYNEKDYYVFIPIESLKKIPDEDIIILKRYKTKEDRLILTFADKETDEIIYQKIKREYSDKYNFE